jgi:hypothetical protein
MSKTVYSLDDVLNNNAAEFELGKRRFVARQTSITENLTIDAAQGIIEEQLKALAPIMSARAVDKKEVTAEWLSDHLTNRTGSILIDILATGEVPGDPKA